MEVLSVSNWIEPSAPPIPAAVGAASRATEAGSVVVPPVESSSPIVTGFGVPAKGKRVRNPVSGLETIIGDDERVAITDTSTDPWRRICQLDLTGPLGTFKGTGWFAGPATVITAGHCVHYAPFFNGWADKITVAPGRHGDDRPFGEAVALRLSTLNVWADTQDADWDIGCVHLDEPLGHATGAFTRSVLAELDLDMRMVNVAGYPTDKDLAKVMYHHANRILKVTDRRVYYEIDTVSGQSGAPVWIQDDPAAESICIAIHAYGIPGTPLDLHITANSAPRIDQKVAEIIDSWVNADNARLGLA